MQTIQTIGDHLKKWQRPLFMLFIVLSVLGNLNDLYLVNIEKSTFNLSIYWINILLSTGILVAHVFFKLNLKIGFAIIIYALFLNLLLNQPSTLIYYEAFIMREILFIGMIILCSGIFVGKIHPVIIGSIYCVYYLTLIHFTKNEFLIENATATIVSAFSFVSFLYYLIFLLEKYFIVQRKYIHDLDSKNRLLKEKQEELVQLNSTKDRYFSILAHDLRNPMQSLLGLNEVVKESIENGKVKDALMYLSSMEGSAQNTYQLLDNLLVWSYSQSGKIQFYPEPFDFRSVMEENISFFENSIQKKILSFQQKCSNKLVFVGDKNMIGTVVRNLISNAIKYSPEGAQIKINCEINKDRFLFSITDNGIGIPPDAIQSIFSISNTRSTKGTQNEAGTGFGLAICKEFVNKHKGKIWVESIVNKGTTFHFEIPISKHSSSKVNNELVSTSFA